MPLAYRELSRPLIEPVTLEQAKDHLRVDFEDEDTIISALIVAARQYVEHFCQRSIFNRRMLLTLDGFPWPGFDSTIGRHPQTAPMDWFYRGLMMRLPKPRTVSVSSIQYIDDTGQSRTIDSSNYTVDLNSEPARIAPAPNYTWPYTSNFRPGSVSVEYISGTYEIAVTDTVVVSASAPYDADLDRADKIIAIASVVDVDSNAVPYVQSATGITVAESYAGRSLTVTYSVNNCPFTIYAAMLLIIGHLYANRESTTAENLKNLPLGVAELLAGEVFDTIY